MRQVLPSCGCATGGVRSGRWIWCAMVVLFVATLMGPASAMAQPAGSVAVAEQPAHHQAGGEANLRLPDLGQASFVGINGRTLLMGGLVVCALGLLFGLVIFTQLKNLPVHGSMREISELIYETCKTYLITQGKFILILEIFIGVDHRAVLRRAPAVRGAARDDHPDLQPGRHRGQLWRRLVRHPGQHLRELARRRLPACAASRTRSTRSRSRPA